MANPTPPSRREALGRGLALGAAAAGALTGAPPLRVAAPEGSSGPARRRFPVSLNTSTLRGQKLPLAETIDIAAEAGYDGIEPWPDEIRRHLEGGGTLRELRDRLGDRGLRVTGAIAFFRWMVDDATERKHALDAAKRSMERLDAIGATHVAAPPAGDVADVRLLAAAERYRALLEAAGDFRVTPAVEVWGFAERLSRLGEAVLVALEARHPRACVLPDAFHLHRGGSGLVSIGLLGARLIAGFHLNDWPDRPREELRDADRVYPGDGVADLEGLFRDLRAIGYGGAVSVELFNPGYWKQDPRRVARTALEKTLATMREAFGTTAGG